jgi:hypothetical protein
MALTPVLFSMFLVKAGAYERTKVFDPEWVSPSQIEQPGVDLPPQGSSAFDKLFFNQKSERYELPFPIHRLVDAVVEHTKKPVNMAYFPFSRSLQRPVDASYDPFEFPRIVFSVGATNQILLRNKLFWGYSQAKDQLEVISYNEEIGRFEFQVVKNYSSKRPDVLYAPRAKCLSCHQAHGPILSEVGWNDSASVKTNSLRLMLLAKHGWSGSNFSDSDDFLQEKLVGPTENAVDNVSLVDQNVRSSEALLNFQRAYAYGCQNSLCRLRLILSEFGICDRSEKSESDFACLFGHQFAQHLDLKGMKVATSRLSEDQQNGFLEKLVLGPSRSERFDIEIAKQWTGIRSITDGLIQYLKKLDPKDNPATSRIEPIERTEARYRLLDQFQFDYFDKERLPFFKVLDEDRQLPLAQNRVFRSLVKLFEQGHPIFSKRFLSLTELISTVEDEWGVKQKSYSRFPRFDIAPHARLSKETIPTFFESEPLNAMIRHCGQCHQSTQTYPVAFLNGPEEAVISSIQNHSGKIRSKIVNQQMPPTKALQEGFLSSDDRNAILDWLEKLEANESKF